MNNRKLDIKTFDEEGNIVYNSNIEIGKLYRHFNYGIGRLSKIDDKYNLYLEFEKGTTKIALMGAGLLQEIEEDIDGNI